MDTPTARLSAVVARCAAIEGPVTEEELARDAVWRLRCSIRLGQIWQHTPVDGVRRYYRVTGVAYDPNEGQLWQLVCDAADHKVTKTLADTHPPEWELVFDGNDGS